MSRPLPGEKWRSCLSGPSATPPPGQQTPAREDEPRQTGTHNRSGDGARVNVRGGRVDGRESHLTEISSVRRETEGTLRRIESAQRGDAIRVDLQRDAERLGYGVGADNVKRRKISRS